MVRRLIVWLILVGLLLPMNGCATGAGTSASPESVIADLEAVARNGGPLQVIATTSIVGEVVRRVGGDRISLEVLLPPGSDPHAWMATPREMAALQGADVLFLNGLGLEAALLPTLGATARDRGLPLVSVNEGVPTLAAIHAGGEDEHAGDSHAREGGVDPHTWQNPRNVQIWAQNVGRALAVLDPANAGAYTAAAEAYMAELEALDAELRNTLAPIPAAQRKLLTDHDAFAYFADAYGFTVIGSVVASFSSLATVSARNLAALQRQAQAEGARALFVGNTLSPALAEQVAADAGLPIVRLFSDSLGPPGEVGDTYAGMMRANAGAILHALHQAARRNGNTADAPCQQRVC